MRKRSERWRESERRKERAENKRDKGAKKGGERKGEKGSGECEDGKRGEKTGTESGKRKWQRDKRMRGREKGGSRGGYPPLITLIQPLHPPDCVCRVQSPGLILPACNKVLSQSCFLHPHKHLLHRSLRVRCPSAGFLRQRLLHVR